MKWLLIVAGSLAAVVMGLLTLLLLGFSTGPVGLVFGMVLAVLPVPIYMMLALWVDRFEREPVWMLTAAFLWGATASVLFAFILNTAFGIAMADAIGNYADMATAVISAPIVEELAKGFALLIFYFWKRDQFDSVLDGVIYAAMVGLGFAMTENILYYGNALAQGGLGGSAFVFVLRGVVSPFAHPLFTSMTGIALGLARLAPRGAARKWFLPPLGILAAMFLHFLWNLSASFGAMFLVTYALVMVPAFLGVIVIVAVSLRKESRIIKEQLQSEWRSGLLSDRDYHELGSFFGRMRGGIGALFGGGWSRWRARIRLHNAASELAFHRWRTARGIHPRRETPAAREARLFAQLQEVSGRPGGAAAGALLLAGGGGGGALPPPPLPVVQVRNSGFGGVLIGFSALGCLGVLALCVLVFAVVLFSAVEEGEAPQVDPEELIEQPAPVRRGR
jgi:protease PrsW